MNFEELWNTTPPDTNGIDLAIFASMQPRRVPFEIASLSDARMVEAYKKTHSSNTNEVASDLGVVQSKGICHKCLLHVKVCRTFGNYLRQFEAEQYKTEKLKSLSKVKPVKKERKKTKAVEKPNQQ